MKLEVVVTDVSQCKKDLAVEIAAEEVKAQFDKAYDAYARHVKVPGFRPGRVPRGVIKQRFSKEVKEEVVGQLLPHALQHVVVDHKLRIVGDPHINDFSVSEGEPLKFSASIEVLPEFDLKEYKRLDVYKRQLSARRFASGARPGCRCRFRTSNSARLEFGIKPRKL